MKLFLKSSVLGPRALALVAKQEQGVVDVLVECSPSDVTGSLAALGADVRYVGISHCTATVSASVLADLGAVQGVSYVEVGSTMFGD